MKKLLFFCFIFFAVSTFAQQTIIGTWSNQENGILVFEQNGKGSYQGSVFNYFSNKKRIIVTDVDGEVYTFNYILEGNKLTLSGGIFAAPVVFTKGKNSTNKTSTNNTQQTNKGGKIDMSIVGTWCWTNASSTYTSSSSNTKCIIIKGDGTYEYTYEGSISGYGGGYYGGSNSQDYDRGTWKLNGNTIHVVSQKHGAASYSFQKRNHPKTGDPMLVIDGESYVTYYQKSPW